jgi:glutamyl-tRNA synthetase
LKSDGFPTYHLANVVDDHLMKISHVLRGDEWISSTPRHILTYEAFGWQLPKFAHMPVILAQGGGKLSKRKGAASVTDYKNLGYLPEALFNFLALLGWAPGDDREIMSTTDIIAAFTLERISPKPAVFDETKLEWMNSCYLREKNTDSIIDKVIEIWIKKGFIDVVNDKDFKNFKKIVELFKDRAKKINDIAEQSVYFFRDPVEYESKAVKKYFNCDSINILKTLKDKINITETFEHNNLENIYREYAAISGISPGGLIHATRLAVSGISFGPGLFEIMEALGKETVLRRIENAIKWIESKI